MIENFNVTGMSCAACQANVTKAVQKLAGVSSVDVSLLGNSMKVDYEANQVSSKEIISAVEKIGYGASSKVEKKKRIVCERNGIKDKKRLKKNKRKQNFV